MIAFQVLLFKTRAGESTVITQTPTLLLIPNLGRGGAQQVFNDQLRFYSQPGVTGAVFNWDDAFTDDQKDNIVSLNVPGGKNGLSKIFNFFKRVKAARALKKRLGITTSISHLEGADYVNVLSKRKGEKTICWVHGSKLHDENIEGTLGWLRKEIFIPFIYKRCDKIVTVSEGIRKELVHDFGIPPEKILTIYNSFELGSISDQSLGSIPAEHAQLFNDNPVLITHCRLSRQKNLFTLLDIFQKINSVSRPKLVILGDGELREQLINYCAEKELKTFHIWDNSLTFSDNFEVYFLGYDRNPYPYLSRATLYVMTSSWEGFPLSLCEAMACGLPVMSADCYTGPREILSPDINSTQPVETPVVSQNGILMPLATDATVTTWAETIISILKDDVLRKELSMHAKERVKAFDRNTISKQWLNLLDELS